MERNLAFSLNNLVAGRAWTLITAIFVHANLIHLAGNMTFLYVFGNTLQLISLGLLFVYVILLSLLTTYILPSLGIR